MRVEKGVRPINRLPEYTRAPSGTLAIRAVHTGLFDNATSRGGRAGWTAGASGAIVGGGSGSDGWGAGVGVATSFAGCRLCSDAGGGAASVGGPAGMLAAVPEASVITRGG